MEGGSRGGFGFRGRGRGHGPYMDHGPQWPEFEYNEGRMDGGGPPFNLGYGMMPPDMPPPMHDRPPYFPPEYEFPDGRIAGFDRGPGWQNEREPYWDRPPGPSKGFPRPFDRSNARMDEKFIKSPWKKPRVFPPSHPAPEKDFSKKYDSHRKSLSQPSHDKSKNQNGEASKEIEHSASKKPKNEEAELPVQLPPPGTTFSCRPCKFETQDEADLQRHFDSYLHQEIIKHLYIFLPNKSVNFLQSYLLHEKSRVSKERKKQTVQKKETSKELFFHRVEVIQCIACDAFIPDLPDRLTEHAKSESHVQKTKALDKDIKSNCLEAAKTILQDTSVLQLLKMHVQGKNPFKYLEKATTHAAGSHEVLVAEEDEEDMAPADEELDAGSDEEPAGTPDKEAAASGVESAPQDDGPPNESKGKKSDDSSAELKMNESKNEDSDGTVDDEEAAEAP
ncbi:A-kinase anchor protein 8-like isoform X2 [Hyperolius riggenbachi]|uniref:A-kinase anchor protein 8-like isoform X2 n=1 Tax=Hyperolius riggenbachi TaxID=752182 RepID=UPI0035A321BD